MKHIDPHTLAFDAQPIWAKLGYPSAAAFAADTTPAPQGNGASMVKTAWDQTQDLIAAHAVQIRNQGTAPLRRRHGEAIVCHKFRSGTYAYPDAALAGDVPQGYFVELWKRRGVVYCVHAGLLAGGYFEPWDSYYLRLSTPLRLKWTRVDEALAFCRRHSLGSVA